MTQKTSWEKSADWYDDLLNQEDTYQRKVIMPHLQRLMAIQKGDTILDLGCGQGFFASEFSKAGARIIGVDTSKKLVTLAKKTVPKGIFYVGSAHELSFLNSDSFEKVAVIMAIQNMEQVGKVFKECFRVLKPGGSLYLVMNHPAFRVPQGSNWGWDETEKVQYRRIDHYLSESKVKIQMHPGGDPDEFTISFHRPLQFYFKTLQATGLLVKRMEEWESHKKSHPGPRARAEDRARKEIPIFLFLEAVKP
ncbi:MAG: class I SAM-dependent methyltransferase [Patescibacteria group bacterium]